MHTRKPATVDVPLSKLRVDPDFDLDQRLARLYLQLGKGQIELSLTRLPISDIASGFFVRRANETVRISNLASKTEFIPAMAQLIRAGARPEIDLYWSPLAPNGGGYVCSDDEVTLAAYSSLNIQLIPCRVLRPKKVDASEGAIWIRYQERRTALVKVVPSTCDKFASFFGDTFTSFPNQLMHLISACTKTRAEIVEFHREHDGRSHYHQMLYAFVLRHERMLDTIRRLVDLNRMEHAGALIRVAYEAFLNFYIDWLSPEFIGPRLQLLSAIRAMQNDSRTISESKLAVLSNFRVFFEKTVEKARVAPLGLIFYNSIYPNLSLISHQSYIYLEHEASGFSETDSIFPLSTIKQLARWIDFITAAILFRVRNDIGIAMAYRDDP